MQEATSITLPLQTKTRNCEARQTPTRRRNIKNTHKTRSHASPPVRARSCVRKITPRHVLFKKAFRAEVGRGFVNEAGEQASRHASKQSKQARQQASKQARTHARKQPSQPTNQPASQPAKVAIKTNNVKRGRSGIPCHHNQAT